MRLRPLAVSLVLAGVLAAGAQAQIRPVSPADAALLKRPPTYEEKIAENVAARLTHLHPKARCGSLGVMASYGVVGITPFIGPPLRPAGYFLMLPEMCANLAAFHASPESYDPMSCHDSNCENTIAGVAMALATVSHESYHLLGYINEARVECYGMQSIWFVASSLGASVAESQRIAAFYWKNIYAERETETPAYWSPQCRDGGKYDLRPSTHSWPS
ncbi:MAG TPA: hypothetical protein VMB53_11490 [Gaiellaceae bacterium]|nr:hypothetical protein [Gaiellaceae bacterium]